MSLDFYGIFMVGRIKRFADDKPVELWTTSNYTNKESKEVESSLQALPFLQEMSVTVRLGFSAEISVVLVPPFEQGLALLNSDLIRWGTGMLEVQFGYTTGDPATRSVPWTGLMMSPDVQISGTDISITLKAVGVGFPMSVSGAADEGSFSGKTPAEVARIILERYSKSKLFILGDDDKLYPDFDGEEARKKHPFFQQPMTSVDGVPTRTDNLTDEQQDTARYDPSKTTRDVAAKKEISEPAVIMKGPRNDWWFLTSLIRLYGLTLVMQGTDVEIRIPNTVFTKSVDSPRTFALRGKIDTEKQIFPINGFSSPSTAVFLSNGVQAVIAQEESINKEDPVSNIQNEENNPDFIGPDTPSANKISRKTQKELDYFKNNYSFLGDSTIRTENEKELDSLTSDYNWLGSPIKADREADYVDKDPSQAQPMPGDPQSIHAAAVAAEWQKARSINGIEVNIETVGIPDLRPEDIVKVTGFSIIDGVENLYDGSYRVIEIVHNIGTGGYTTTWKGIRTTNMLSLRDATDQAVAGQSSIQTDETSATVVRKPVNPNLNAFDPSKPE